MRKHVFKLVALMALLVVSAFASSVYAATEYRYEPSPNLQCNGTPSNERMRGSLLNQSGQTVHVKRWYQLVGGSKQYIDASYFTLDNNTSNNQSYIKAWSDDLQAIGWDVDESVTGISIANTSNSCVF